MTVTCESRRITAGPYASSREIHAHCLKGHLKDNFWLRMHGPLAVCKVAWCAWSGVLAALTMCGSSKILQCEGKLAPSSDSNHFFRYSQPGDPDNLIWLNNECEGHAMKASGVMNERDKLSVMQVIHRGCRRWLGWSEAYKSSSVSLRQTPAWMTSWILSFVPSERYDSAQQASVRTSSSPVCMSLARVGSASRVCRYHKHGLLLAGYQGTVMNEHVTGGIPAKPSRC